MNNFLPPPFFRFPFSMHYPGCNLYRKNNYINQNNSNFYNKNIASTNVQPSSSDCSNNSSKENCENKYTKNSNLDFFSFLPKTIGPLSFNPNGITDNKEPIFELFGINLYLDDIIIIGILIFLYKQEVKDDGLYLVLILLLLS